MGGWCITIIFSYDCIGWWWDFIILNIVNLMFYIKKVSVSILIFSLFQYSSHLVIQPQYVTLFHIVTKSSCIFVANIFNVVIHTGMWERSMQTTIFSVVMMTEITRISIILRLKIVCRNVGVDPVIVCGQSIKLLMKVLK